MKHSRYVIAFGLAILCAGCTTQLETRHGLTAAALQSSPLDSAKGRLQFLGYAVPAAQFRITIKSRPAKCTAGAVSSSEIQATVETQYVAGERYAIDYASLAAFTKITSVSTTLYPNGTLKSVNAEASDQTIETATAAVKLVATVAGLGGKAMGVVEDPRCTALNTRNAERATMKAAKDKADSAIGILLASDPDPDTAEEVGKKLAGLQGIRDAILAKLTALEASGWQGADTVWPTSPTAPVRLNQDELVKVGKVDALHVMLTRVDDPSDANESFAAPDARAPAFGGLVWRQGYRARLALAWCGDGLEAGDDPWPVYTGCPGGAASPGSILMTSVAVVPQAGPFFLIPLRNGIGRNNAIAASFLADGSIETASYGDKVAIGNHIATASNDLAAAVGSLMPSQTAKLTARKSCLDAVDGLRKSQVALADLVGSDATTDARFAAYTAKCLE